MTEGAWELEHEGEPPPKMEFKAKAHLVLEGSERFDWGVVKDCHGNINYIPPDAEVVGTWNKYSSGPGQELTFWVSLQTSLEALQDRATQLYKELAEGRAEAMERLDKVAPGKRTPRTKKEPKAEKPSEFDALRRKLRGG